MKKCLLLTICLGLAWGWARADGGGKAKKCANPAPDAMEGFIFVGSASASSCTSGQQQQTEGVITFYRWYLQNSEKIRAYEAREQKDGQDMVPPLNLSWNRLQQYINYIRKTYPGLDTIRQAFSQSKPLSLSGKPPTDRFPASAIAEVLKK